MRINGEEKVFSLTFVFYFETYNYFSVSGYLTLSPKSSANFTSFYCRHLLRFLNTIFCHRFKISLTPLIFRRLKQAWHYEMKSTSYVEINTRKHSRIERAKNNVINSWTNSITAILQRSLGVGKQSLTRQRPKDPSTVLRYFQGANIITIADDFMCSGPYNLIQFQAEQCAMHGRGVQRGERPTKMK